MLFILIDRTADTGVHQKLCRKPEMRFGISERTLRNARDESCCVALSDLA